MTAKSNRNSTQTTHEFENDIDEEVHNCDACVYL
jgi:hypothetical protein